MLIIRIIFDIKLNLIEIKVVFIEIQIDLTLQVI